MKTRLGIVSFIFILVFSSCHFCKPNKVVIPVRPYKIKPLSDTVANQTTVQPIGYLPIPSKAGTYFYNPSGTSGPDPTLITNDGYIVMGAPAGYSDSAYIENFSVNLIGATPHYSYIFSVSDVYTGASLTIPITDPSLSGTSTGRIPVSPGEPIIIKVQVNAGSAPPPTFTWSFDLDYPPL